MAQKTLPYAVGLDIGSKTVRCIIGMQEEEAPAPSIIGLGEAPSSGVRKGVIVDIEESVSCLTAAVDEAERISGINIDHATVGVNGAHLLTVASHGVIAIGSSARDISEQDVARVEEAATVMQLPPNREIIQAFARNYMIDGQEHIKDPVGMNGVRLEVDSSLITAGTPFIKNLTRSVHQAGLAVDNHVAGPLAAAATLVDKKQRDLGTVLIDIGAATTGLAVFEEGDLLDVAVLPVGSGHITNDLAIGLRTDIETAEKIKLDYVNGSAKAKNGKSEREIRVKELNGEVMRASSQEVNRIAQARLEEIFEMVNHELHKIKRDGMLPGGAILCGGGANLRGLEEVAKQTLRLPAHIGRPEGYSGIVDKIGKPQYATVVGLMIENLQIEHRTSPVGTVVSVFGSAKDFVKNLYHRFRK